MFANITDVPTLAKGYKNAQQLVGAKRIALPGPNATETEKQEFYKAIGRPETFDKYSEPTVQLAAGLNIDKASVTKMRETMFSLGLSDTQQKGLMDAYFTGINDTSKQILQGAEASKATTMQALRQEWGQNFDANMGLVNSAIRKFATPEAVTELETGLGNNLGLVKMFHNMGKALSEDRTPGGGIPLTTGSPESAVFRIAELKQDKVFMDALSNNTNSGHKDAVALWAEIHKQATPQNKEIK